MAKTKEPKSFEDFEGDDLFVLNVENSLAKEIMTQTGCTFSEARQVASQVPQEHIVACFEEAKSQVQTSAQPVVGGPLIDNIRDLLKNLDPQVKAIALQLLLKLIGLGG